MTWLQGLSMVILVIAVFALIAMYLTRRKACPRCVRARMTQSINFEAAENQLDAALSESDDDDDDSDHET